MSKSVPPVFLKEFYGFWSYSLHLFLYLVLGNVLIPFFPGSCPVFPAPLIEETFSSPLSILASFVVD